MDEKTPQPSEAQEQARARAASLARDFSEVFGFARKRTGPQSRVIEHLAALARGEGNAFQFGASAEDGIRVALRAAHIDGAQSVLRVIERQLSIAGSQKAEKPKAAATVKR